jgi:uncharacterized protein with gpF-like domain
VKVGRMDGREIKDISQDTLTRTQEIIASWQGDLEANFDDLVSNLSSLYSQPRAQLIGTTETTWLGSLVSEDMMQRLGVNAWSWSSLNDWLVCPVCMDLQTGGVLFHVGDPEPPEHPGCRCDMVIDDGDIEAAPVIGLAAGGNGED